MGIRTISTCSKQSISSCSLCSGITNSNGVAEVTVTVSAETIFTATYSNATATCTVTVPSYLFYDECNSSSGLTNYGSAVGLEGSTSATLSYNSTENAYSLISTGSGIKVFPITALNGLNSFKLTADMKFPNTSSMGGGLSCIIASTNTGATVICNKSAPQDFTRQFAENGSEKQWSNVASLSSFDYTKYYKVELIVDGYEAKYTFYDGTTQLATYTYTLNTLSNQFTTLANRGYGLGCGWKNATSYPIFVKNIKAESL